MSDGSDVPGDWDPSGQAEPPAALLRRAISHVEQLLGRLEHAGAPPDEATVVIPIGSALAQRTPLDLDGALEPAGLANPLRRISSASQAEALRVSLNAHEKANRLLAEASAIRAQSAAEGEQILIEARDLADRVEIEVRDQGAEYVARARSDSERMVLQTAEEMQRMRDAARQECDRLRDEAATEAQRRVESAQQDAEQLRNEAAAEAQREVESAHQDAQRLRREVADEVHALRDSARQIHSAAQGEARAEREAANAAIREVLDKATIDSEQMRVQARIQARVDAAEMVAREVETALAQARSAVDADRRRIQDMLHAANAGVADVRTSMRAITEALSRSMATVNGAASSVEVLLSRFGTSAWTPADTAAQRSDGRRAAEALPDSACNDGAGAAERSLRDGSAPENNRHRGGPNGDAHNVASAVHNGGAHEPAGAGHNGDDDIAATLRPEREPADHDPMHRPLGSLFGGPRKPRSPNR